MDDFFFTNPVDIHFGNDGLQKLPLLVGDKKTLLVTSKGWRRRGLVDTIQGELNLAPVVIDYVEANPDLELLSKAFAQLQDIEYDTIVALGGGSVIDFAKALSVQLESPSFEALEGTIRGATPSCYSIVPLIAVPTTAGTGSDLTPWGTIWDKQTKKKYSLHLDDLWPKASVLVPKLLLSLPISVTIESALDALSHCLESIWNKNANPVSRSHAVRGAKLILENIGEVHANPSSAKHRSNLMLGATFAGLAFSNTKTAIAHAISYHLTLHHNVPHGIACSFSLPDIIDSVLGDYPEVDGALFEIFGSEPGAKLRRLYELLGCSTDISSFGVKTHEIETIKDGLASNPRAGNSLVNVESLFVRLSS